MAAGHVVYMSHGVAVSSFSYLVLRRRLAPCRLGVSACAWVVCVCTHVRVVKMAAIARTYEQKNALALQRSSFRENPTYFLTSVESWVCELVFDAIYDWRSEFSHNRQTTTVTLAAHARRGLIKVQTLGANIYLAGRGQSCCACGRLLESARVNEHGKYTETKKPCTSCTDESLVARCLTMPGIYL